MIMATQMLRSAEYHYADLRRMGAHKDDKFFVVALQNEHGQPYYRSCDSSKGLDVFVKRILRNHKAAQLPWAVYGRLQTGQFVAFTSKDLVLGRVPTIYGGKP